MRHNRLFYFIALLFTLPVCGFGQTIPVPPSMLLNIGGLDASVYSTDSKSDAQGNIYVIGYFVYGTDPVVLFGYVASQRERIKCSCPKAEQRRPAIQAMY